MISTKINISGFHGRIHGPNERLLDPFSLLGQSSNPYMIYSLCRVDLRQSKMQLNIWCKWLIPFWVGWLFSFCGVVQYYENGSVIKTEVFLMLRAAVDLTEEWLNVLSQIFMGYEYIENEKLFVFHCFSYILSTLKSIYGRDVTFRVTVEFLRFFRIKYRFRQSVQQSISVALYDVLVKEPNIANI